MILLAGYRGHSGSNLRGEVAVLSLEIAVKMADGVNEIEDAEVASCRQVRGWPKADRMAFYRLVLDRRFFETDGELWVFLNEARKNGDTKGLPEFGYFDEDEWKP
ncbi:MAG: hypothetical protein JSS72_08420 [Armatimonadetes bacterium]|nr:hypothetical protein [Armatimonadota bacterium]